MTYIDQYNQKFKAVKKNNQYYLLLITRNIYGETKYKIEVTGKQNVYAYIKNNHLKKYEEIDWLMYE